MNAQQTPANVRIYPWVKKLGIWHLHTTNDHNTLCGFPMLGTNYARNIPEADREKCAACFEIHASRPKTYGPIKT